MLSGVAGVVGLVSFYAALAAGTMGVVSPIAALGVVVPVLVGFAQGERPAVWQLVGIVVAIAGVVLASGPELSGRAGARPVLLAARGRGRLRAGAARDRRRAAQHSTLMTLITMRVTSVTLLVGALVVALARGGRRSDYLLDRRDVLLVALVGVARPGRQPHLRAGQPRGTDVSVVSVLGSLYPVVTVLLARVVPRRAARRGCRRPVSSLALAGVVLIAAG